MVAYCLAEEYERVGNYEEALKYYREAEEKFPKPEYKEKAKEAIGRVKGRIEAKNLEARVEKEEILFVVSCTKRKIWDENPEAPEYVSAKDAYVGDTFKEWLTIKPSFGRWIILSAKYGFIEPEHPISRYNVTFDDEATGPISEASLVNQVLFQNRWKDGKRLRDFNMIVVFGSETYYNKVCKAFSQTRAQVLKWEEWIESKYKTKLDLKLNELLSKQSIKLGEVERKQIPETSGIYVVYEEGKPLYVGKTSNLRRRILDNHLGGNKNSSVLRKKLYEKQFHDEDKVTRFLREKCYVKFMTIQDINLLKSLEHYAIALLNPPLND
ncbi:MAG: DUF6884 domain-containing protein [Candidatus Baldrarchaeia archaeon]